MPTMRHPMALAACALLAASFASTALAQTVATFTPIRDGTIYEPFDIFLYSNGAGDYFFVGRTGQSEGSRRRGLVAFDLTSIPPGSTVTSVTLRLHMSRSTSGSQNISLRKMLVAWGEGASDAEANEGAGADPMPGDVTWQHRFFPDVLWTTPGGDYPTIQSAVRSVAGVNFYTWGSSIAMVNDTQSWVNNPAINFGWAVINNSDAIHTAKRFDTRENKDPSFHPRLTVTYTPPVVECPADWDDNGVVNSTDVSSFINDWFLDQVEGTLITDFDDNGVVNSTDVSAFINDWFVALAPGGCGT